MFKSLAKILLTGLLVLSFSVGAGAEENKSLPTLQNSQNAYGNGDLDKLDDFSNIRILNKGQHILEHKFEDNGIKIAKKSITYSNIGQYDYGAGILRSIFGDYIAIANGDGSTKQNDRTYANSNATGVNYAPIAGIFHPESYATKMMQVALLKITYVMLWVFAAFMLFAGLWALIRDGGQENSIMGKWGTNKAPYKMLVSLILIFPTTTGYTIGHLMYLQMSSISNYLGKVVTAASISILSPDYMQNSLRNHIARTLDQTQDMMPLMKNILKSTYCLKHMNLDGTGDYGPVLVLNNTTIGFNFGTTPNKKGVYGINATSYDQSLTKQNPRESKNYKEYIQQLSKVEVPYDYCGKITLPFNINAGMLKDGQPLSDADKSGSDYSRNFVINTVSLLQTKALQDVIKQSLDFWNGKTIGNVEGIELTLDDANLREKGYLKIVNMLHNMEITYYRNLRQYFATGDLSLSVDNGDQTGWVWDWFNSGYNNQLSFNFPAFMLSAKDLSNTPQGKFLEKTMELSLKSTSNENINFEEAKLNAANEVVKKFNATGNGNSALLSKTLSPYTRLINHISAHGWIELGSWFSVLSGYSTGFDVLQFNPIAYSKPTFARTRVSEDNDKNQSSSVNHTGINLALWNKLDMYLDPIVYQSASLNAMAGRLGSGTGNGVGGSFDFNNPAGSVEGGWGVSLSRMFGYDPMKREHPLSQLKDTGDNLLLAALSMISLDAIGSLKVNDADNGQGTAQNYDVSGSIPSKSGFLSWIQNAVSTLIGKTTSLATFFSIFLVVLGVILSVALPLIPVIYWVSGVLSWVIGLILNFVSIPLVGISLAFSNSDDFLGRAMNAFMAYLDNLLRPILMPIAFYCSIGLSSIFVALSTRLITQSYLFNGTTSNPLATLGFVLIYSITVYFFLLSTFALIKIIPEKMSQRINGIAAADDEADKHIQHISMSLQQARSEGSMLSRGMMSGGR